MPEISISHERSAESERRLRVVIRAAELVHLDGAWCFQRITGYAPAGAVATVRDADGWCALMPATEHATDRFGVTMTTFAPELENSGRSEERRVGKECRL